MSETRTGIRTFGCYCYGRTHLTRRQKSACRYLKIYIRQLTSVYLPSGSALIENLTSYRKSLLRSSQSSIQLPSLFHASQVTLEFIMRYPCHQIFPTFNQLVYPLSGRLYLVGLPSQLVLEFLTTPIHSRSFRKTLNGHLTLPSYGFHLFEFKICHYHLLPPPANFLPLALPFT